MEQDHKNPLFLLLIGSPGMVTDNFQGYQDVTYIIH